MISEKEEERVYEENEKIVKERLRKDPAMAGELLEELDLNSNELYDVLQEDDEIDSEEYGELIDKYDSRKAFRQKSNSKVYYLQGNGEERGKLKEYVERRAREN
ncbi:MAG: hypothetical protein ACLFTY_02580 [Candidatus Aenigmatarchaeota archaeon]